MGYKNWRTPADKFAALHAQFHFTIDVMASHANALLPRYCTVDGTFEKYPKSEAKVRQVSEFNGLSPEAWKGENVFDNPPYDETIGKVVELANQHLANLSCLVLPPSIDTEWFAALWPNSGGGEPVTTDDYVGMRFKTFTYQREIRFYRKRWKFLTPAHLKANAVDESDYDEEDTESTVGPAPRAGNLVVITFG